VQQITSGAGNLKGEGWGSDMPSTESEWEYAIKNRLDIGFKVFKVDTSNIKLWDDTPIENGDIETLFDRMDGHIDGLKPDHSNEDLVFEILLKMGYPLTADLTAVDVGELTVHKADSGKILICLQEGVTADHIEAMAALAPQKKCSCRAQPRRQQHKGKRLLFAG